MKSMLYAGVGSRATPEPVLDLMRRCATRLELLGYTLRSGGANGADTAFEEGCCRKELYLPWPGFNGRQSEFQTVCNKALALAASLHPRWERLSSPARRLMARNCYQILGTDLASPVDFVLCWTPDGVEDERGRTQLTGGTGQAIALASRHDIPVFNIATGDALVRLRGFLEMEM